MTLTLGQIADWMHAEGDFDELAEVTGYSIDSRTLSAGDLFFAVKGERSDGHDFVETALANGAVAAVVRIGWLVPAGVDDARLLKIVDGEDCVLHAMQRLATAVRRAWGKRVIGITGSAGKTTTKECIAQVLAARFNVLKTEGNLNNHFGVPLTLLRLEPEHDVAVVEMGMNHGGEITALCRIAEPDWGVVSNVGTAHIEFFADGVAGIARAKRELVDALPSDGLAFLNADDERVATFGRGMAERAVMYGTRADAQVHAVAVQGLGLEGSAFTVQTEREQAQLRLHLIGGHNVLNALAACAVGTASGIPLTVCAEALEQLRPTEKRGNVVEWRGARIINDTYNSNPGALDAMMRALAETSATRRVVIAGEMLELGDSSVAMHAECGGYAAGCGVDVAVGVRGAARAFAEGASAAGVPQTAFIETVEETGNWMTKNLREGDVVLLKASRGVRLEHALDALRAEGGVHRE